MNQRWYPRNWSLRVKLLIVLLVPGILAVVLGGLRIADQTGEAAELDRVARFATVQGQVASLVEDVSQERYRSTVFVAGGRTGDGAELQAGFGEVDGSVAAIRPTVESLGTDDPALVGAVRQSEQALSRLPALRTLVLTSNAPSSAVISRYSELIDQLITLNDAVLRGVNTTAVNGLSTALAGLSVARTEASLQYALVSAAAVGNQPVGTAAAALQASEARLRTGLADFRSALDPGQRVRYATLIAGPANTARGGLVQSLLAVPAGQAPPPGTAAAAVGVFDAVLADLDGAEDGVRAELATTSADRRVAASDLAGLNAVLLLAALLLGALIVGVIARGMITSLRTLRRSALDVAERQLPDAVQAMREGSVPDVDVSPVPVTSREEVGEVARAFDAVHVQAVRLAAEQATLQGNVNRMFVNLSRRSQTLVDRQLQLIEQLESKEQDPDQLSNLFRLDHLATRMRRNSENLLVLAGTDLAKRSAQQVPVVDVLRAAVSEVEQYERVVVEHPPLCGVAGRAANDVQHLLSELLDNATSFSPPDSQVRMSSIRIGSGQLVVEITDHGVGMPAAELVEVNRQLGTRTSVSVTTSRRMGLFVVGRLASRHGIEVRLVTGPTLTQARVQRGGVPVEMGNDPGLTARVTVPAHLIVGGAPRPGGPARPAPQSAPLPPQQRDGNPVFPPRPPAAQSPAAPPTVAPAPAGSIGPDAGAHPSAGGQRLNPVGPRAAAPEPRRSSLDGPPVALPSLGTTPIFEEVSSGWFRPTARPAPPAPGAPVPPPAADLPVPRDEDQPSFDSTADAGWVAAGGVPADDADEGDDTGLPRRTPGARLVPGSAGTGPGPRPRSAESVRGRLADYQRGTRQARTGRPDTDGVPVDATSGSE